MLWSSPLLLYWSKDNCLFVLSHHDLVKCFYRNQILVMVLFRGAEHQADVDGTP